MSAVTIRISDLSPKLHLGLLADSAYSVERGTKGQGTAPIELNRQFVSRQEYSFCFSMPSHALTATPNVDTKREWSPLQVTISP